MSQRIGDFLRSVAGQRLAALVIVGIVVAAYHNSFSGPLVMDDYDSIRDNPSIRQLWPPRAVLSPPPEAGVAGRPLANVSYALNYAASGLEVWSYHAVNLALHLAAVCALFGIVRRTLQLPLLEQRYGHSAVLLAALAALLWGVHPLLTTAVNYVSQRTEVLMSACYLATLYGFLRSATATGPHALRWKIATVVACVAGMLSKEVMVTAPVTLAVYDRIFLAGSWREVFRRRAGLHAALAATWLVLVVLMATSPLRERSVGFDLGVTPLGYALAESRAVLLYLQLTLWPSPLVFDHGYAFLTPAEAWPYVLALLAVLAGVVTLLCRRPAAGFSLAWFFLLLAPTSSVVPVALQPVAESRPYLASAGVIALAVIAGYRWLGSRIAWVCLPLVVLGSVATLQRNLDYQDDITLWTDTVVKRPRNPRAHTNLAAALSRVGRADEAAVHAGAAVKLQPDNPFAWTNLGAAFYQVDVMAEAIKHFEKAVQVQPEAHQTHCNLADALLRDGQVDRALTEYQQSLKLNPVYAKAHRNYSLGLRIAHRLPEALTHARKAVELEPTNPDSLYVLGATLLASQQPAESIPVFEATLRLRPNFPEATRNLQAARKQAGKQ